MSRFELPPPPWIAGHRGAAGEALENTAEAFRQGRRAGADLIELDVQLAADGVLVCYHDWTLERLANRAAVVEDEASGMLVSIPMGAEHAVMPTLAAALEEIPEPMPLNVELKRRRASADALVRAVLDILANREQVLISSFDWELLELVRSLAPQLPLAPLSAPREMRLVSADPVGDLIAAGEALGAFSLHCSRLMVDSAMVGRAAQRGFTRLLSYTVNDPAEAEALFRLGISGIFTDFPSAMVARFCADRRGGMAPRTE